MASPAARPSLAAFSWKCLLLATGILGALVLPYVLAGGEDMLRAYPSPERHADVHALEVPAAWAAAVPDPAPAGGDFDGDGTADELSIEYFHMEPLFERATSGLVYVRSGRMHEVLLAHATDAPLNTAWWCGDVDGNGTDDVLVLDEGRRFVLGKR